MLWLNFIVHNHQLLNLYNDYQFQINCSTSQIDLLELSSNIENQKKVQTPTFTLEVNEISNKLTNSNSLVADNSVVFGRSYSLVAKIHNFDSKFLIHSCAIYSLPNKLKTNENTIQVCYVFCFIILKLFLFKYFILQICLI